jgi:hypothetical protein
MRPVPLQNFASAAGDRSLAAFLKRRGPDSDAETLELFTEYVGKFSKTREDIKTWFDAIELDDYVSFGGKT